MKLARLAMVFLQMEMLVSQKLILVELLYFLFKLTHKVAELSINLTGWIGS